MPLHLAAAKVNAGSHRRKKSTPPPPFPAPQVFGWLDPRAVQIDAFRRRLVAWRRYLGDWEFLEALLQGTTGDVRHGLCFACCRMDLPSLSWVVMTLRLTNLHAVSCPRVLFFYEYDALCFLLAGCVPRVRLTMYRCFLF